MSGHAPAPPPSAPNPLGRSGTWTVCPGGLGACASSSFFIVSIGGQAGQSHFFLRVLQVICKEQREVKGDLNAKLSSCKMQFKMKRKHGTKQLIYTHNLSMADFFHNSFSFCFTNSTLLQQTGVLCEQRSRGPSSLASCSLSNLRTSSVATRRHLPGTDSKIRHLNFLTLEDMSQSCTNRAHPFFSLTLMLFKHLRV